NILKPALARGQIQLIGATTIQEYRRCIEKDAALERRFAQIMVEEPSREASVNILRGLKSRFEVFHNVTISDEAICAAVDLAIRYIPERFLPDKAIDLLDDTAAGRAIENARERKIAPLMPEDIGKTVTRLTGVPSNELSINEQQKLETLEKELQSEVKGQTEAIKTVANAVIRAKLGFSGTQRPLASFLFCGASGVGKTHLARQMAIKIFGSEKLLFRFDMSEYSEGASASRLIGAPPGYVGHTEPGQLTEAVRRHPFCILLFDEIEKASKEVYGLLLQLLDDGALTDNLGRRVNFKNTIVVATANVANSKCGSLGFANGGEMLKTDAEKINFGGLLTTEILGRFDEVVTFDPLKKEAFCDIATKMLFALAQKMAERKIYLTFSSGVVSLIANAGSEKFGARPLRGALRKNVEDVLCKKMINGIINAGDRVSLTTENETVVVNVTAPQKVEKKPMATVVK
ncbi:MAG: ATP-dependent Clp protease ATP-binding subunit, partial [Oscillospiraceae bacterium]